MDKFEKLDMHLKYNKPVIPVTNIIAPLFRPKELVEFMTLCTSYHMEALNLMFELLKAERTLNRSNADCAFMHFTRVIRNSMTQFVEPKNNWVEGTQDNMSLCTTNIIGTQLCYDSYLKNFSPTMNKLEGTVRLDLNKAVFTTKSFVLGHYNAD